MMKQNKRRLLIHSTRPLSRAVQLWGDFDESHRRWEPTYQTETGPRVTATRPTNLFALRGWSCSPQASCTAISRSGMTTAPSRHPADKKISNTRRAEGAVASAGAGPDQGQPGSSARRVVVESQFNTSARPGVLHSHRVPTHLLSGNPKRLRGGVSTSATYYNRRRFAALGREMHCKQNSGPGLGFLRSNAYVTNYGVAGVPRSI